MTHHLEDYPTIILTEELVEVDLLDICFNNNEIVIEATDFTQEQTFTLLHSTDIVANLPLYYMQNYDTECGGLTPTLEVWEGGSSISQPSFINFTLDDDGIPIDVTVNPVEGDPPGIYTVVITYTLDSDTTIMTSREHLIVTVLDACATGNSIYITPHNIVSPQTYYIRSSEDLVITHSVIQD